MKKKIALITLSTPTFNNVRAASALPYHLIKGYGSENAEFRVYSFDINHISTKDRQATELALGITISLLPRPKWVDFMVRFRLLLLRIFLRYPLGAYFRLDETHLTDIKGFAPDMVWIYGEDIAGLARHFSGVPRIVTMPDCESMYYHRLLRKRFATNSFLKLMRYAFAYHQYRSMERDRWTEGVTYHFVGDEDARFYKEINPRADVRFLRHPLYAFRDKEIGFGSPKIKLLIAGRNDIYMAEATAELVDALVGPSSHAEGRRLQDSFNITFLGKGWEAHVKRLTGAGYEVSHVSFAPDYIEELQRHDIQITPISVGTGTKGKVLDAIANGLLAIGTAGAVENIAVENKVSCIEYEYAETLVKQLHDISQRRENYEQMARRGRESVVLLHNSKTIAKQLFDS